MLKFGLGFSCGHMHSSHRILRVLKRVDFYDFEDYGYIGNLGVVIPYLPTQRVTFFSKSKTPRLTTIHSMPYKTDTQPLRLGERGD